MVTTGPEEYNTKILVWPHCLLGLLTMRSNALFFSLECGTSESRGITFTIYTTVSLVLWCSCYATGVADYYEYVSYFIPTVVNSARFSPQSWCLVKGYIWCLVGPPREVNKLINICVYVKRVDLLQNRLLQWNWSSVTEFSFEGHTQRKYLISFFMDTGISHTVNQQKSWLLLCFSMISVILSCISRYNYPFVHVPLIDDGEKRVLPSRTNITF